MTRIIPVVMACLGGIALAAQTNSAIGFDADPDGTPPGRFTFEAMRQDAPGSWLVRHEAANGFLVHTPEASQTGYTMAITPEAPVADLSLSVRMRLSGGERAGGLVWRYQDPSNFYAAILDLSRGALFLSMARNGNLITLESEDDLELDPEAWHTLRVMQSGDTVYVWLGGIRVFDERDERLARSFGAGRLGLIVTGSSSVSFDDLRLAPPRSRR
ncbi:MAG: family 16 glycoside hydrolase [Vicinamibacterales bacterium]